jgi:hypothetical protein
LQQRCRRRRLRRRWSVNAVQTGREITAGGHVGGRKVTHGAPRVRAQRWRSGHAVAWRPAGRLSTAGTITERFLFYSKKKSLILVYLVTSHKRIL